MLAAVKGLSRELLASSGFDPGLLGLLGSVTVLRVELPLWVFGSTVYRSPKQRGRIVLKVFYLWFFSPASLTERDFGLKDLRTRTYWHQAVCVLNRVAVKRKHLERYCFNSSESLVSHMCTK